MSNSNISNSNMSNSNFMAISNVIDLVENFPKSGINFRDINPLFANTKLRQIALNMLFDKIKHLTIDCVVGIDARGFPLGMALSDKLNCGFSMARKNNGKLPNVISQSYGLEYGSDALCVQPAVFVPNMKILIVDDLLATGGTTEAVIKLMNKINCEVVGICCLIELLGLERKEGLKNYQIYSLLEYMANSTSKIPENLHLDIVQHIPIQPFSETDNRIVVFAHKSMQQFADKIILSNSNFRYGGIIWSHFPDGYPNIEFEHMKYLENKRVIFIASICDIASFLEQVSMFIVLPRQLIKSLDIILPYFAPATAERVDIEGQLATGETTAKSLISSIPPTKEGLARLHIFDIHALPVRFYFPDNVITKMHSAIELLKRLIDQNTTIVFPDEGAFKRFKLFFEEYRIIVCAKIRNGDKRIIRIADKINWPFDNNKDPAFNCKYMEKLLIVDDLVQSGSTLEECRKALIQMGGKYVSAYVTHAVFPNESYKKFIKPSNLSISESSNYFENFYISDSNPISNKLINCNPFKIISICDYISNDLINSYNLATSNNNICNTFKYYGPHINIYVCSVNQTKLNAVYKAFDHYMIKFNQPYKLNIFGFNISSDVPEQPIGREQTMFGCQNRLNNAKIYLSKNKINYDWIVSMENGVELIENDITRDFVAVQMLNLKYVGELQNNDSSIESLEYMCNLKTNIYISFGKITTIFPKYYYDKSIEFNQKLTVGSIIEKECGYKKNNWHQHFDNKISREKMLEDAIITSLQQMQN